MKKASLTISTAVFAALMSFGESGRTAIYDEGIDGSLSNNHLAPTSFPATSGSNTVKGQVQGAAATKWDYITFTVPTGSVLSSVELDSYSTNGGPSNVSFFAIAAGASVSSPPPGSNPISSVLGWILFKAGNIGSNLLPAMSIAGAGATGFTPPLSPGTYTFWIQDTAQTVDYEFSFEVTGSASAALTAKRMEVARLDKAFKKARKVYKENKTPKNKMKLKTAAKKLKIAKAQLKALTVS